MTCLAKGEASETPKGVDADGEHAGVWTPSSSWGLPGPSLDFIHDVMTLVTLVFRSSFIHYFSPEEGEEAKSVCSIWWEKVS